MPPDRRQIILIILSLTLLAGLTSFFTWQALMRKPADPWAALPQGTEAVARINAASFFGKPATANNELLSRLGSLPWAGPSIRNLMDLDSLYRLSPERFNGMNQNELLLVLAATRNGWASFLMADASGVFGRRQWLDALALLGKVQPGSSPEKYSFSAKTDPPAQLEFRNGLLIISYGVPQAQQSATTFTSPPPAIREALRHAGSKVIASLLISNGLLHNILLMSDSLPYPPPWTGSEEGWTVLDINVKSRDIYL
ncbi:MAG: hypothetical protein IH599_07570, partial [Bacteroidales bacterium]|nr:hypothetical protein [Bacteroidales bacterium]